MRPKLAGLWKEWAAKNSDSLKMMAPAASGAGAGDLDLVDELAEIFGN